MCDFSAYGGASEEWLAIQRTLPPAPSGDVDIKSLKISANSTRDAAARDAMKSLAKLVTVKDYTITARDGSELRARSYRPASATSLEQFPTYLHLHGGGFAFGTLESEDAICARISSSTYVVVLNVCYRHTPEHKYPTAWQDVEDAFQWLHENILSLGRIASQVVVGGISAGAWLAASLVQGQRLGAVAQRLPPIAGQILMIPCLVHEKSYGPQLSKMAGPSISSYRENEFAPILPLARSRLFLSLLDVPDPQESDTRLNPGNASVDQVRHLPPTVFGIAGLDILRDEGLLYAKLLHDAGVATNVHLFRGVPHGFRRYGDRLTASSRWDSVMSEGILWTLSKPEAQDEFRIDSGD